MSGDYEPGTDPRGARRLWSPKDIEKLVNAIDKSLSVLRERIGKGSILSVKVHRSEVVVYCRVKRLNDEYTIKIKYNKKGEIWVEGPRGIAIPIKNKVTYFLRRQ